jgi:hypothetical protein
MGLNIDKEVAQMRRMTVCELQTRFAEVCGEQPPQPQPAMDDQTSCLETSGPRARRTF